MDWKALLRHSCLGLGLLIFSGIASFAFSVAVQQLGTWAPAGIIIAGFLMGRLWLTIVQWAEAGDSHIPLFGGIAAIIASAVLLLVWRSDYTGEATIALLSLLLPFILDQKKEKWKPAVKYGLKWFLAGAAILIALGFVSRPGV